MDFYSFDKNLTFHEIIDVLNKEVLEINEYLKKKDAEEQGRSAISRMGFYKRVPLD